MLDATRLRWCYIPLGLALIALAGCSRRTVTVSGTVTFPDKVTLQKDDIVQIVFIPESKEETKAGLAIFSRDDKSFVCKDVLPGTKYKIAVHIEPPFGAENVKKRAAAFADVNKAFDRAATKLKYEASEESSQSITIDLAKGAVTKQ
jgi:hypothetical protein